MAEKLTHLDSRGNVKMVDVTPKPESERMAIARGEVRMQRATLELIQGGNLRKGDLIATAKIAGVMAAKRTAELIPMCHPIPLTHVEVELEGDESLPGLRITATARTTGKTGVEMEALMAVSVAALTVYDMAKAVEKTMRIQNIHLVEKRGGKSGDFVSQESE